MNFSVITTLECSLLIGLGALFAIQMIYIVVCYRQPVARHKCKYTEELPPISVIVTTKDAANWLRAHLLQLLEQDYPCFEVIVVNDASEDETDDLLKRYEREYPHLYHTFTPATSRHVSRKKLSLTLGIRAAKYDWLLFIEQGCYPVSNQWLRRMARNFTEGTDIVLGYSNYTPAKGWLSALICFNRLLLHLRFLSAARLHFPYMGVGANLAYRKELYYSVKGYSKYLHLQRGEDDLFINQTATRHNTRIEVSRESIVRLDYMPTAKAWTEGKVVRACTEHLMKGIYRLVWSVDSGTRLLFMIGVLALVAHAIYHWHALIGIAALTLWILYYMVYGIVLHNVSKALGERTFTATLPLMHLLHPLCEATFKLLWRIRHKSDFLRK